jgi:hypothetical protein
MGLLRRGPGSFFSTLCAMLQGRRGSFLREEDEEKKREQGDNE